MRGATTIQRHARTEPLPPDLPVIITIDGPAGTGKSTVARRVAAALGLDFLDTGAMYRAAAAIVIDHGMGEDDPEAIVEKVAHADLHFDWSADPPAMLAWDKPVDDRIRDADVTGLVSRIAAIGALRQHMVRKQRLIGHQHPRLVTEGRDQGSVVFPDAEVRFFLDADPEERARRRAEQLRAAGRDADEAVILTEILERDRRDFANVAQFIRDMGGPADSGAASGKPEPGMIVIDTSGLTLDEVVDALVREVRARVLHD